MSSERARELVMQYGWNATCYQILNPGISHWFSCTTAAVAGYTRKYRTLLVAGSPVCAAERLPDVCAEFEAFARSEGCRVCYVCAEERLRDLFEQSPQHAIVTLGAQPVWDPREWPAVIQKQRSLRAQLNRCRNKKVTVERLTPTEAANNPELNRILAEWLRSRCLPPMHFLVEPHILSTLVDDRAIFVARRETVPVAFLVGCPMVARCGYLVELLARTPAAPNGASELLIDHAMRDFAREGNTRVTLGLVALARAADQGIERNPLWLSTMMKLARAHANRFYNFQGLEQFRVKMSPHEWEPVYAIATEKHFSPLTLYSMGAAFAGRSPWSAVGLGAVKALRQEFAGKP